jgi:DNA-binding winged helix-turn-helix (wHTH) protein/Tol biopolymer transport system component
VSSNLKPVVRYRFGLIDVDPASGEIYKSGLRVRVPKKPFQILLALLERPGEVVTRETLRAQLWSHDTFVEFEHALNAAINRLRLSLGDDAANPCYIETVPGRGYRLIVPVETPARPVVIELPPPGSAPHRSRWLWLSAVAVLAALTTGVWIGRRSRPLPALGPIVRFTISPPPGAVFVPSTGRQAFQLSPDGRYLAFTARGADTLRSLWIRDLGQPESRELPDTRDAYSVFWSPDGGYLYYTVFNGGALRRTSLTGGPYDLLAQLPPRFFSAWFHQGEIRSADHDHGWAVPIAGGSPRKLAIAQPWAQPLPKGDRVIYTAWDEARSINEVRLAAPDQPGTTLFESDSRVFLTPSSRNPDRSWLLYLRGGNLVARGFDHKAGRLTSDGPFPITSQVPYFRTTGSVEASVAGGTLVWLDHPDRSQLVWVDREGRELSSVGPVLSSFNNVRLSADGRWAVIPVVDRARGILDIWTVEIGTGAVRKVSTSEATLDMPVISPDADRIVCAKAGGRPPLMLTMLILRDGVVPDKLPAGLPEGYSQLPTDWSPDGRFIAMTCSPFARDRQQNADAYLVDLARNGELVPLLVSPRVEGGAIFAPDGRSIAFLSDESGHREVYVQRFDPEARRLTGIRRQISRGGAAIVRWPKPGRELFYLGADYWIYAATLTGEPKRLFLVSQHAASRLHPPFGFDVAPGGDRFLLPAYRGDRPSLLAVVLNWENLVGSSSSNLAATR